MAYYIALYLSRAPEARYMEPKQLQAALRQTMTVSTRTHTAASSNIYSGGHVRPATCLHQAGNLIQHWVLPTHKPDVGGMPLAMVAAGGALESPHTDTMLPWLLLLLLLLLVVSPSPPTGHQAQPLPGHLGLGPLPVPLGCCQLQCPAAV
jgi:hypothetical protein